MLPCCAHFWGGFPPPAGTAGTECRCRARLHLKAPYLSPLIGQSRLGQEYFGTFLQLGCAPCVCHRFSCLPPAGLGITKPILLIDCVYHPTFGNIPTYVNSAIFLLASSLVYSTQSHIPDLVFLSCASLHPAPSQALVTTTSTSHQETIPTPCAGADRHSGARRTDKWSFTASGPKLPFPPALSLPVPT